MMKIRMKNVLTSVDWRRKADVLSFWFVLVFIFYNDEDGDEKCIDLASLVD